LCATTSDLYQLVDDLLALGALHVDAEALLAPVVRFEVRAEAVRLPAQRAAEVPHVPLLDLDYLGAHIREHRRAPRPLLIPREIDDANAIEWPHAMPP
jgi:hypothetical protein